jgi:cytochrome P450
MLKGVTSTTCADLSDLDGFWTAPIARRAAAFAALREHEPISFHRQPEMPNLPPGPGFWALTRFDDVVEASRHPAVFTSGSGATSLAERRPSSVSSSAR